MNPDPGEPKQCESSVADPDPGLGAFLTPGSGIRDGRKSASGSGIRDEQPGSNFLELRNHFFAFFGVKIPKFFDEDPGWRQFGSGIRDGKKSCAADFSLLNLPKGKSLGRSKPATNS
jgi:hypothetical protein